MNLLQIPGLPKRSATDYLELKLELLQMQERELERKLKPMAAYQSDLMALYTEELAVLGELAWWNRFMNYVHTGK